MEVITSHVNADFDTLASMVAAKKLYPRAVPVFSGSLEKPLRDALPALELPCVIERARNVDLDAVTRLILVDIRSAARLGPFAAVAGRPGVDIHIYDHHPGGDADLHGSVEVIESCGSTTTILTLILKERGMGLTAAEATILMAGVYEDTGFLSYPTTTTRDYEAAAFLLAAGADLSRVSDLLRNELTTAEISTLNELIQSETVYTIGGVDISVASADVEKYPADVASLAHRLRDIRGMECLFLLGDMGDRVHIVARSRTPAVNVGEVMRRLGGGGHPSAASATLKSTTLVEARERLLAAVREVVSPVRTASEVMSSPAITVGVETTLADAERTLMRYNINAAPVVDDGGALMGVVTRQVVDKAVYHGLGEAPVRDYMTTDCQHVSVSSGLDEVREKVIVHGQRLLPVLGDARVEGVITRTDLLKLLHEELVEEPRGPKKRKNLRSLMEEMLPRWALRILRDAGEVSEELGYRAYVVGGFVRDLLLRRENLDIDIVIEGDGIRFAKVMAERHRLRVRSHERFKTAVLVYPDGYKVDVATARLEYYERPGALPTVEHSSLKLDLYRRDFTINTLAVSLEPSRFGQLIDFFGARRDIKERTIKVIHNLSFVEDPTRVLRAVRFSRRFGFRIARHTANLMKNTMKLDLMGKVSGSRLLEELKNILCEEDIAVEALKTLSELGLTGLLHPQMRLDEAAFDLLERARSTLQWHRLLYLDDRIEPWLVLFLALTDGLGEEELDEYARRLTISGKHRLEVLRARGAGLRALSAMETAAASDTPLLGSTIYSLLRPLPLEVTLYLMAKTASEKAQKAVSLYVTRLRFVKTELRGRDVMALGVPHGPAVGEVLNLLLKMRLDGQLRSRGDEEAFVRDFLLREP
ncbi:MAG TPA: CBS domain-containing protein [Deltaproteobacteria bacterium]|nr:CBS domain-containing protein [Deltaproteobacteria bacterium]